MLQRVAVQHRGKEHCSLQEDRAIGTQVTLSQSQAILYRFLWAHCSRQIVDHATLLTSEVFWIVSSHNRQQSFHVKQDHLMCARVLLT